MEYDPSEFEGPGVYSNTQIRDALSIGHIICEPYVPDYVNTTSLDVRLGEHFYRITAPSLDALVFNPFDEEHVQNHFELKHAEAHHKVCKRLGLEALQSITSIHPVIALKPKERILGHTLEFIGIKPPGTSSMQARSSVGRAGINVCQDAGWGDAGYINRWTMEIYNNNSREVLLPVGMRIAQIVFHHTGAVDGEYATDTGKYQRGKADDIRSIIEDWQPSDMLPRIYKDRILPYPKVSKHDDGYIDESVAL